MKKDELVHLHTLLALVRSEYERRGVAPPGAFDAYDDLDVSPMAVYGSKSTHEQAVKVLARELAAVSTDGTDREAAVPSQ